MTNYVFYDATSGAITHTMTTDDKTIAPRQSDPFIEVAAFPANMEGYTVTGGVLTPPTDAVALAMAQTAKIIILTSDYTAAYQLPVTFISAGGVSDTYQADDGSIANLQKMLLAFAGTKTVPAGFYWVSLSNAQVPFTYADMQGLAAVFGDQGAAAFSKLQDLKGQVRAATSPAEVAAITW